MMRLSYRLVSMNQEYLIDLNEKDALEAIEISSLNMNLNNHCCCSNELLGSCALTIYQQLKEQINFFSPKIINSQLAKFLIIQAYYQSEKIFFYQATLLNDKKTLHYSLYLQRAFLLNMDYTKTKDYILFLSEKKQLEKTISSNFVPQLIKL